ncbi:HP0495 family protein [Helicobacter mustelae]|uniref:DUF493 domain-containing protein n=1 Tax=Helicobacter mustelae (strain ATCC 43772 / CCUG 25715 / CIP 103759 / LMG 18044 / NCTC 12198 / R85-136P) TaxID=679897 RepID=D3UJ88_HELM1|nr:DUF493 domain-containing protein [Helicobacter mustelae]CBG40563.1 putative hypothetical protein [Helicobacter mustelae 12198]SQH72060.1 Uncharacterized conserved protein [Helicobacter mustelae]STP13203.1 Uncharacterized conserved protein [Helicobacter mustelae]
MGRTQDRPRIDYPCKWEYRIIATQEQAVVMAVFEIIEGEYQLEIANHSANGRFVSLHLIVEVASEKIRDEIFQKLTKIPQVKMVI